MFGSKHTEGRRTVAHGILLIATCVFTAVSAIALADETLNGRDTGYRGIWYMNQPSGDRYVYKYSGGLGTYCAKHQPFAVYRPEVDKTFFCYGGTTADSNRRLLHMVSYFDHKTQQVPQPTILLDRRTDDAHDNPVISIDDKGHIWIFSTSHGRARPSYIHRTRKPHDIRAFDRMRPTTVSKGKRVPITNFSYMQAWHMPGNGFLCFFTKYGRPAKRTSFFMSSTDGVHWSEQKPLAAIEEGHYQISALGRSRAGTALNLHPRGKGLNWRTNLYYMETRDGGQSWQTAGGEKLQLPLTSVKNPALIQDYQSKSLNVYLKDLVYDADDRPIILFLTSRGYRAGPQKYPRTWYTARWTGTEWDLRRVFHSDSNYDMGSLWIEKEAWRIIAPVIPGPQKYNPGGEVGRWDSFDLGRTWKLTKQLTTKSPRNHTYVRRPVNAHADFFAFWADGHGRQPSISQLYFSNRDGDVRVLPRTMTSASEMPATR